MTTELGERKLKVSFQYFRVVERLDQRSVACFVAWEDEGPCIRGYGIAMCHRNDNFDRRVGRKIALARALKSAGLGKEDRRAVWREYRLTHRYALGRGPDRAKERAG